MSSSIFVVIKRAFLQAMRSLERSKWSSLMTFVALTLVFLLVHTMTAFISSAENIVVNLQSKVDIGVFFTETAEDYEIDNFLTQLDRKKETGVIKDYTYFSRDQELEEFEKMYPGRMAFLRRHNLENPLLAMVEIVPIKGKTEELSAFLFREENASVVNQTLLRDSEKEREQVKNFLEIASFVENSGDFILYFFIFIAVGLLFHAVGIAVKMHEKEIFIMRLVGAQFWNIRLPYIFEGIILALSAFAASLLLASVLFFSLSLFVQNDFSDPDIQLSIINFTNKILRVFSWDVLKNALIILFLALIASFAAIERHLRIQKIL